MKINTLALSASLLAAASVVSAADGTINFTGELVDAACTVAASTADPLAVELGTYSTSSLASNGEQTVATPFAIDLENCSAGTLTGVAAKFEGAADASNSNLFAVTGGASNVGIQVEDPTNGNTVMAPNTLPASYQPLADGVNSLNYQARYVATGAATAGSANATVTYSIVYE